jgi:hypothetical protein
MLEADRLHPLAIGAAARGLAELSRKLGDQSRAQEHFQHAIALNLHMGHRPELVRTRLGFSRSLEEAGTAVFGLQSLLFGLTEQAVFHEIDQDRIDQVRGMDITVVTTATTDDEGRSLLKLLGFPFKEN